MCSGVSDDVGKGRRINTSCTAAAAAAAAAAIP